MIDQPLPLEQRCQDLLTGLNLMPEHTPITVEPLTGGVASDIAKVKVHNQTYCVKFAIPKLRVATDWFAPLERSYTEYCWLKAVSAIEPRSSLKLYGHSKDHHGFVMEYLTGASSYLLKSVLLEGRGRPEDITAIGKLLGRIHAASTQEQFDQSPFQNHDDFHALRIDSYLLYTATQHPALIEPFHQMADHLYKANSVLIHGDVSPKNIMFNNNRPYILDSECATMGDAAFDLAFCLNHFILKAIHIPQCRSAYLPFCIAFWEAYAPSVCWELPSDLQARLTTLLPMLMLARVDGKSPVEYLSPENQALVRKIAIPLIKNPQQELSPFLAIIEAGLSS